MGQGDLDGGGLAGEGGGWMKRDSIYMIESSNGALDGGCSDGQIWRGTTGVLVAGRAGWRARGWMEGGLLYGGLVTSRMAEGRWKKGLVDEGQWCIEGGWMEGWMEGWWMEASRMVGGGLADGGWKEGWMEGGLAGGCGLGLGLKVAGVEGWMDGGLAGSAGWE